MKSKELRVAISASKAAGKIIMKHYGNICCIKTKSARLGVVTEADIKAQKKIKAVIRKSFPKAEFLAEEDKNHPKVSNNDIWVVDPLDGTTNFTRGIKSFAVSIGLVKNKKPVVGAIFDPSTNDLFYAEKGKGAFLNGKRIKASNIKQMEDAVFDAPVSVRQGMRKRHFAVLKKLVKGRLGLLRILGSAALRLAFISAGRFDAWIEYGPYPWDFAAGSVILKEAGGKITNDKGQPLDLFSHTQTIVATNGKIHSQLLKELNK